LQELTERDILLEINKVLRQTLYRYGKNLTSKKLYLLGTKPASFGSSLVIHDTETDRMAFAGDRSYIPYPLWMVGDLPTMAFTGTGR
jgi:hypothetical protein